MKQLDEFKSMILNAQCRKAECYIKSLYEKEPVKEYADALTAVILRETNTYLNNNLGGYFIDDALFTGMLFGEEKIPEGEIISKMCSFVKNAHVIDRERAFLKAQSFIDENIQSPQLYSAVVAEHTGICQAQLTKLFESKTGQTPSEYISQKRVQKSEPLLREGGKSVSEVAFLSGFSSVETYIRAFKKQYGTTPGKYMQGEN